MKLLILAIYFTVLVTVKSDGGCRVHNKYSEFQCCLKNWTNTTQKHQDFWNEEISEVCYSTEDPSLPLIVWNGEKNPNSNLERFQRMIEEKYNVNFDSYLDFHTWTVENYAEFWGEIWHYIGVIASKPYDKVFVKTGPGFLDNAWFSGARFNVAENLLRFRDDSVAVIISNELREEESITFAQLFEEVKLYAAAFRKNGLKKGDTVAYYMSNRKESLFALLATASIGAIWGGPQPFYGKMGATQIISMLDPKFLISVDAFQCKGIEYDLLSNLPFISENALNLVKVILVVTKEETLQKNVSGIKNLVFLNDFLQDGKNPDGTVPDIVFEQLPANHPKSVVFTSGTTGRPKGIILPIVSFLVDAQGFDIYFNLKKGDVVLADDYPGWALQEWLISPLFLGSTLILHCGHTFHKSSGLSFWQLLDKYDVMYFYRTPYSMKQIEVSGGLPDSVDNLENWKIVSIGSTPIKKQCYEYLHKIKKDLFIDNSYGTSECSGMLSGMNVNMPTYEGEVQIPSLGVNIQSFDEEGKSVVDQKGELVISTPAPIFLVGLWNDTNNYFLKQNYLDKYPGVWSLNDVGWINSKTNGINVIGRSDNTLKQHGGTFGSEAVYNIIQEMEELDDYICVGQHNLYGDSRAILFIKFRKGIEFTSKLEHKIRIHILKELDTYLVPELILEASDIPYNFNQKKLENLVHKIINDNKIPEVPNCMNPESLNQFLDIPEVLSYNIM